MWFVERGLLGWRRPRSRFVGALGDEIELEVCEGIGRGLGPLTIPVCLLPGALPEAGIGVGLWP